MKFTFDILNKKDKLAIKIVFAFFTLMVYGYVFSAGMGGERGVLLYALIFGYIWKVWRSKNTTTNKVINGFMLWIIASIVGVALDFLFLNNSDLLVILMFVIFLFSTLFESDRE